MYWDAFDESLDRAVVVILMPSDHRRTSSVVDFAHRVTLVDDSRVVHPVDVGTTQDTTYVVLPAVQGPTLTTRVRDGGLPSREARRIIGEAAEALTRADDQGLHHGHLTPDRIRFDPSGRIRVLGIGLDAAIAGTIDPDPARSRRQDAVDLVRLLSTALTGLWPGTEPSSLPLSPRSAGSFVTPAELLGGIDPDLNALCSATLGPCAAGPNSPTDLAELLLPWDPDTPAEDLDGLALTATVSPRTSSTVPETSVPSAISPVEDVEEPINEIGTTSSSDTPPVSPSDPMPPTPSAAPVSQDPDPSTSPATPTSMVTPPSPVTQPTSDPGQDAGPADQAKHRGAGLSRPRLSRPWSLPPSPTGTDSRTWDDVTQVGLPASTREIPAPFLSPVPVRRPPEEEIQFVVKVMIGFLVVVSLVAAGTLIVLSVDRPPASSEVSASNATSSTAVPSGSTTASVSATSSSAATPDLAGIQAIDPQGDGSENDARAQNAIDRDPKTVWKSSYYATAAFAGLKKGVGLALRMADDTPVQQVTIDIQGSGGVVELRTAEGPGLDGSTVVATSKIADGQVQLTPTTPVNSRWLILWFTTLPRTADHYQLVVSEIGVR